MGNNGEVIGRLEAKGFDVKLGPGLPGSNDRHVAYVARGGLSRGYFGRTEIEALEKAAESAEGGAWQELSCQTPPP